GTDAISAQNCLLVNLRNLAGELKRSGRWFVSGCPKVSVIDGIWLDTYVNVTVQAWLDTVLNIPLGGDDGRLRLEPSGVGLVDKCLRRDRWERS
ncbi:unnamed protein product, partial [marine sediment metagenome]